MYKRRKNLIEFKYNCNGNVVRRNNCVGQIVHVWNNWFSVIVPQKHILDLRFVNSPAHEEVNPFFFFPTIIRKRRKFTIVEFCLLVINIYFVPFTTSIAPTKKDEYQLSFSVALVSPTHSLVIFIITTYLQF